MTAEKVLRQERQLAEAIATVFTDEKYMNQVDELLSNIRVEQHSLTLARAVYEKLGIQTAYDALLEEAMESERIEKMIAAQSPQAAETVKKLRAEFSSLPTDGLKALRMLIDSAIREKEA
jgi:hypothetical protein